MIPFFLERAILNGWADFQTISHAFSSFGTLPIPNNSTVIITHIKWFPFINPIVLKDENENVITKWKDLFRYNEYQLNIDGKKSNNNLQFRNAFEFKITDLNYSFNLQDPVDENVFNKQFLFLQAPPIQQDVYFVCEEYIKLSLTRNCYIDPINTVYNLLQPIANIKDSPVGLKDVNLLLRAEMISPIPNNNTQYYFPATPKLDGFDLADGRKKNSYTHDIDKDYSQITDLDSATHFFASQYPFATSPLVEFGIVTINNNHFDKIKNQ
jgi:hypothetical protein